MATSLGLAPLLPRGATAKEADVTTPIVIPLQTLAYPTKAAVPTYYKYGIYVSLGGSTTPQLFEFDTGGEGFHAAYSDAAPWWGSDISFDKGTFTKTFDSKITYTGNAVTTGFSLFGLPTQGSPLLLSTVKSHYKVGAASSITQNGSDLWPSPNGSSPPVEDYFYGDFGLSLKKGSGDIANLFTQLKYADSVKPGYIVSLGPYGSMAGSSVQLGLFDTDLNNPATTWFAMQGADPQNTFPHTERPSFSAELLLSDLSLTHRDIKPLTLSALGVNLDTGTPGLTLHYNPDVADLLQDFSELNDKNDPKKLRHKIILDLTAVDNANQTQSLLNLLTGDTYGFDKVLEFKRSDNEPTYINSGATLFQNTNVIFDLTNQRVGFSARTPVPGPSPLLLSLGGLAWARRLRRRCRSTVQRD